ncbi:hypothetical protein L1286_02265 [Pseudoalteromonas sp. SMS1]|uniref:hypothetical protein n=1 Tax=Pseudoalteromonas sp. SMS1 TaxID=2908894 RepID=UPI001F179916|nr:hypothetical protein [Pseudoalteromonas sp. SMS1]MCF2856279.1 hypothetical protein [Pseudoalteromonas sp. SMS1]
MTGFAYSIEFEKNNPDHKLTVVFFLCLWFVLLLVLPELWWLSAVLCVIAFIDAQHRLVKLMPSAGVILVQEGECGLHLTGRALDIQGEVVFAQRYTNWLLVSVKTDQGIRRVGFIASAMDKASWSHFNRIALSFR